jgi:hypothetical protein
MAQYNLVHQFKEQGFNNVTFASGTTNALYVGGFLYADSSTPSNFTIFAFHKQEPNSDNPQHDYLICHLIQVEGQKKSLDEIKASLKQSVHVPSDFKGLGTRIQLFGAASTIFFGEDSVCTSNLNQLLTMIGRNKKSFQDQIALDDFFCRQIPFCNRQTSSTVAEVVQIAHISCTQVNNRILQFEDPIDTVLNGTLFHMNLPPSFAKVSGQVATSSAPTENKQADGKNKDGSEDGKGQKIQKCDDGNGNLIKNTTQPIEFKLTAGELWKDNFETFLTHDRPAWTDKIWVCTRWHLKGDCYDNFARAVSHVINNNIPNKK